MPARGLDRKQRLARIAIDTNISDFVICATASTSPPSADNRPKFGGAGIAVPQIVTHNP